MQIELHVIPALEPIFVTATFESFFLLLQLNFTTAVKHPKILPHLLQAKNTIFSAYKLRTSGRRMVELWFRNYIFFSLLLVAFLLILLPALDGLCSFNGIFLCSARFYATLAF